MAFLSLKTSPFYSVVNVYYIVRFSIACYSTFTTSTKKNLHYGQKIAQSLGNNETLYVFQTWTKANKKFDLKYKYPLLEYHSLSSKQNAIALKYNKLSCFERIEYEKQMASFINTLVKFHREELVELCKQFNQKKNWVPTISYYSRIDQCHELQLAFRSLMDACLHIETSADPNLEQRFAFNSVCEFISDFIEEIYLQLEELNDTATNSCQLQLIATEIDTGINFIEELLHSHLVQDVRLHWFCIDRINLLTDQCFELGEILHERK